MKKIPEFKDDVEEFEFWSTVDSTEYFDWSKAEKTKFENLRPTPQLPYVTNPDQNVSSM